jgi:acyl-coenzyme A synthetase/AMP-(fatty) acid ligase/thioesterase domain-containing protein
MPVPDPLQVQLVARFDAVAERVGTKAAIIDGGISLPFANVRAASFELAEKISSLPDGPVGALLELEAVFVIVALAARRLGRPFVALDARHPEARLSSVGRQAGLSVVICDKPQIAPGALLDIPRLILPDGLKDAQDNSVLSAPSAGAAFITFTSGSTGEPKGICNGDAAILHRVDHFAATLGRSGDDVVALTTSPGTIAGLRDAFGALLGGATLVAAQPSRLGIDGMLNAIASRAVTVAYMVPALLRSVVRQPLARERLASLRLLRIGGDVLWETDLAEVREILPPPCAILYGYGSTECPTVFHFVVPPNWRGDGGQVPLGVPQPGLAFDLVGDNGETVPAGSEGELVVRGHSVALGLWRSGRLDTSASPTDAQGVRTLHTGDLMRVGPDGFYRAVGRIGRMVKIRGLRADPGELEAALKGINGIADAAAVVRYRNGIAVGFDAVVVARPGSVLDPVLLRSIIAGRLEPHLRPGTLAVVPAIPLLPGFKADLIAVAALVEATRTSGLGARVDVHPAVAEAWATVFGRASLGRDDAFDDAGGNSLGAMDLLMLVERASGVRLPVDAIPASVRPSGLSVLLAQELAPPLEQKGLAADTRPFIAMFPGIGGDEPAFAALRAALGANITVHPITYQNAASLLASGGSLQSVAAGAIVAIEQNRNPGAPLHLLGYSFGGFVAWEVAGALRAIGVSVASVILLDTGHGVGGSPPSARGRLRSRVRWAVWWSVAFAIASLPAHLLHRLAQLAPALPGRIGTAMNRVIVKEVHSRALRGSIQRFLDIPVLLLRSGNRPELGNLGWTDLAPKVAVTQIEGDHFTMLSGSSLTDCAAQIQQALSTYS